MLLAQLRERLMAGATPSLGEVAREMQVPADVLVTMLQPWLQRGRLTLQRPQSSCATRCGHCGSASAGACDTDQRLVWNG